MANDYKTSLSPTSSRSIPPIKLTLFRSATRSDILDMALSKNLPTAIRVESITNLSSDHNAIHISLGGKLGASESTLQKSVC